MAPATATGGTDVQKLEAPSELASHVSSDGSGGPHSSDRRLRRASYDRVLLDVSRVPPALGALQEDAERGRQDSPRSELMGCRVVHNCSGPKADGTQAEHRPCECPSPDAAVAGRAVQAYWGGASTLPIRLAHQEDEDEHSMPEVPSSVECTRDVGARRMLDWARVAEVYRPMPKECRAAVCVLGGGQWSEQRRREATGTAH